MSHAPPGYQVSAVIRGRQTTISIPGWFVDALRQPEGLLALQQLGAASFRQVEQLLSRYTNDEQLALELASKADLVDGKIPLSQVPAVALSEFKGVVNSEAAMLALTAEPGDFCRRTDGAFAGTWILTNSPASDVANWIVLLAETSLTTRVSLEEVARDAADASLTTRVSLEEVARAALLRTFGRADSYTLSANETVTITLTSDKLVERRTLVAASGTSTAIAVLTRSGASTGALAVLKLQFPFLRSLSAIEVRDDTAGGTLLYRARGAQASYAVQLILQRSASGWDLVSADPTTAELPHNMHMVRWAVETYLLALSTTQTFSGGSGSTNYVALNSSTQWSSAVVQGGHFIPAISGRQIANTLWGLNWDVLARVEVRLHDVLAQCPNSAFRWGMVSNSSGWVTASASNNVGLPASTLVGIGFEVRDNASWWGWTHNGTTLVYTDLGFTQGDRGGGQGGSLTEAGWSYEASGVVRWYVAGIERASYQITGSWISAAGLYPRLLMSGCIGDTAAGANSGPYLQIHRIGVRVP